MTVSNHLAYMIGMFALDNKTVKFSMVRKPHTAIYLPMDFFAAETI